MKIDQRVKVASWLTAMMALLAGGYALQGMIGALGFAFYGASEWNHCYQMAVPFVLFIFAATMMAYSRKLGMGERVSKIPYFIPIVVLILDVYFTIAFDHFTGGELWFRGILPTLSAITLLCLHGREFE